MVNRNLYRGHSRVRLLDRKIDPDLFARLMQLPARARKDLFEYIGQGPMGTPPPEAVTHALSAMGTEPSKTGGPKG
jgi:hypothetical protein